MWLRVARPTVAARLAALIVLAGIVALLASQEVSQAPKRDAARLFPLELLSVGAHAAEPNACGRAAER